MNVNSSLRNVSLSDTFILSTWDTFQRTQNGRYLIGYRLEHNGTAVFEGEDFACGMSTAIDSDEALRGILGFLTLGEHDVESEYFDEYTTAQLVFRDTWAESLSMWAHDEGDAEFEEIDLS